ncbi:MAG TPA: adenylate/guanylate cyclase domain-containing protein [Stellaceae bacterium]|nr:adenylate/guanylate cyclase domain-containing protein [Stellaceae bacterium]
MERRLAAILAADVAGYSRLVGADEEGTLAALKALRRELIDPSVAEHRGRIVKTTGDGLLVEFASVVDALRCATHFQPLIRERNAGTAADRRIEFRIGIHQGDVVVEEGDIFGDGVNVAARLEALAEPGGICVSARVHEDAAGKLDIAFEDLGDQALKNIARPVRVYQVRRDDALSTISRPQLTLPDKPSIAVLPFANMSGDPEQEYFADGMVEEIITAFSRIHWLFVIARNSSFTYKGQAVDVKQVGRELGVRYVLEGSVRKGGNRVRITAQLIEAESGAHLWADRFDGSLEDIFELQEKVAVSVAGIIEPTLQAAEIRRSANRATRDLTAYDLYLRALAEVTACEKDRMIQALAMLDEAIAREPRYGRALALAAVYRVDLENHSWADDIEQNRLEAIDLARRALRDGADDPTVLGRAALVLGRLGEDIDAAIALIDRALALNPSFANGWYWSGWLRLIAGQADLAIEHFETSLRLSPRDQQGFHLAGIGTALFANERFADAAATLRVALEALPSFTVTYRTLASCYAHMDRIDDAREIVRRLRLLTPAVVPTIRFLRDPKQLELYLSGLRLAIGETS